MGETSLWGQTILSTYFLSLHLARHLVHTAGRKHFVHFLMTREEERRRRSVGERSEAPKSTPSATSLQWWGAVGTGERKRERVALRDKEESRQIKWQIKVNKAKRAIIGNEGVRQAGKGQKWGKKERQRGAKEFNYWQQAKQIDTAQASLGDMSLVSPTAIRHEL